MKKALMLIVVAFLAVASVSGCKNGTPQQQKEPVGGAG